MLTEDSEVSPIAKYFFEGKALFATCKDFHLKEKFEFIEGEWWPDGPQSRPYCYFKRLKIDEYKSKGVQDDGS